MLRGAPPAAALHWAASAVGPGARGRLVRPLAGGTSSAVHTGTSSPNSAASTRLATSGQIREPNISLQ